MTKLGLRARKRARTYTQIVEAAMELLFEKGFDSTTLDDVAEAADIHKRTLLRYFPSKTHLFLHGPYDALANFKDLIAHRGDTSVIDIWYEFVEFYAHQYERSPRAAKVHNLTSSVPVLVAATQSIIAEYQVLIYNELCAERGGDDTQRIRYRVAAAALVGGNYGVADIWISRDAARELWSVLLQVIDLVKSRLLS